MFHAFPQTLFDCGNKLFWHNAAHDSVYKFKIHGAIGSRLKSDGNNAKLARASRLFLMAALCLCSFSNRFPVGNFGLAQLCLYAEFVLQLIAYRLNMQLAHTGHQHIARFHIFAHCESRILFFHAAKPCDHLIFLSLLFC